MSKGWAKHLQVFNLLSAHMLLFINPGVSIRDTDAGEVSRRFRFILGERIDRDVPW